MGEVTVTRRLTFSAAHRLHEPALTDDENRELFGLCNSPYGHGHNYALEVAVRGRVDPRTGYVVDLKQLKEIVNTHLVAHLDHRNLNFDVEFLDGINPTTENLVVRSWAILEPLIQPARLLRLRLWETENNYVEYEG
jgi:6-pyruvoyltetrahydropterin/6-carboxytetrahydropterin synthase